MPDFVAYHSRWRLALLFALAAGFMVIGAMLAGLWGELPELANSRRGRRLPPELVPYVGWLCLVFFGLCAAAIGKKFFDGEAQLIININGITSPQWSNKLIGWPDITNVTTWSQRGQKFIVLHLRDPSLFPARGVAGKLAYANRVLTSGDLSISLTGTDRSFDDAMSAIEGFQNTVRDVRATPSS